MTKRTWAIWLLGLGIIAGSWADNLQKGKEAFMQNNLPAAIPYLELSIQEQPREGEVYAWLALAYEQTGRADLASTTLQKAITAQAGSAAVHYTGLGNLYARTNKPQDALTAYNTALALDPTLLTAILNRANLLVRTGAYADARAGYMSFLGTAPGHSKEPEVLAMIAAIDAELADQVARQEAERIEAERKAAEAERLAELARQQAIQDKERQEAERLRQEEAARQAEAQRLASEEARKAEEARRQALFDSVLSGLEDASTELFQVGGGVEEVNDNEEFFGREN